MEIFSALLAMCAGNELTLSELDIVLLCLVQGIVLAERGWFSDETIWVTYGIWSVMYLT